VGAGARLPATHLDGICAGRQLSLEQLAEDLLADLDGALHDQWDCALSARIDAAAANMPDSEHRSPRRVLHTVIAAVGAHVTEDPPTCRVLMEARILAAYQPAIAAAVRAADARARAQLASLIQAGITAREWPAGTDPGLQARLVTATLHGMMAPGTWHPDRSPGMAWPTP
jgi:AcrR family transcriptional regulator